MKTLLVNVEEIQQLGFGTSGIPKSRPPSKNDPLVTHIIFTHINSLFIFKCTLGVRLDQSKQTS